jgi:hypothetical protein
MARYRRYSLEDIAFIESNAGKMHNEDIAKHVNSTEEAIRTYICRNNLKPKKRIILIKQADLDKQQTKIIRPAAEYSNQDWSKY